MCTAQEDRVCKTIYLTVAQFPIVTLSPTRLTSHVLYLQSLLMCDLCVSVFYCVTQLFPDQLKNWLFVNVCRYCFAEIRPAGLPAALGISQKSSNPLIVMLFFSSDRHTTPNKRLGQPRVRGVCVCVRAHVHTCVCVSSILVIPHSFSLCVK